MTRVLLAGPVVCLAICSGCLATRKPSAAEGQPVEKKIVGPSEYEYVYVTGSLIPVKVPKSASARALPGANPVSTMDAESFDRLIRRGQGPMQSGR